MSNAFIEMNKAYVGGDMQSHQKLRTDVSICHSHAFGVA